MFDTIAIVTIVERGKADYIVSRAKIVGAQGATILYGRGSGEHEVQKFLKIDIKSSKEIIIILSETSKYKDIFNEIIDAGKLNEPGTGIIFTTPVNNLIGLHHRDDF